jgi:basic membrane protein A
MTCGPAANFVKKMGGPSYYGGLETGLVDISPLSDNCADGTAKAVEKVKDLIVSGKWDVFSGMKLQISADGTITMMDDDLIDILGSLIVQAGSSSIDDAIITGTMNYFVEGVRIVK